MPRLKENICEEHLYDQLFRMYSEDLFKLLYYKFGNQINPADIVQEAFLKLWENCHKVPPEKVKSYLFTVGNNLMINQLARQKTATTYANEYSTSNEDETPLFVLETQEFDQRIQQAMAALTEDQRITLLLNKVEGKRHQEIADMLGISRKAVEKRIYKALTILKEKMTDLKI